MVYFPTSIVKIVLYSEDGSTFTLDVKKAIDHGIDLDDLKAIFDVNYGLLEDPFSWESGISSEERKKI